MRSWQLGLNEKDSLYHLLVLSWLITRFTYSSLIYTKYTHRSYPAPVRQWLQSQLHDQYIISDQQQSITDLLHCRSLKSTLHLCVTLWRGDDIISSVTGMWCSFRVWGPFCRCTSPEANLVPQTGTLQTQTTQSAVIYKVSSYTNTYSWFQRISCWLFNDTTA